MKKLIWLSLIACTGIINAEVSITIKNQTGKHYNIQYPNSTPTCYFAGSMFTPGKDEIKLNVANGTKATLAFYDAQDCPKPKKANHLDKNITLHDGNTYTLKCSSGSTKHCGNILVKQDSVKNTKK